MILTSLEITRRVLGYILPVLGILFLIQLYMGPYMGSIFGHKGPTLVRSIEYIS
jgi:TRAP-type uncharacterized transport system fused permease subunit